MIEIINRFKTLTYNIGFVKKELFDIQNTSLTKNDIIWMKHHYKDRYFADPFLIDENEKFYYILAEEYTFWEIKGKIVLLTVNKENFSLIERKLLIEEKWHLSFPYCKCKGEWIVPEAVASKMSYAYKLDKKTWKITKKVKIANEGLIDNVFFKEKNNIWCYASTIEGPCSELYLFKLENNFLEKQSKTPFICDLSRARSAGDFFEYNDKIFRPVQDCSEYYGKQTIVLEIDKIDNNGFSYKDSFKVDSYSNPPYNESLHTFNVYDDIILVDGSKEFMRFPMKFFYRRCSFIFKIVNYFKGEK